MWRRGALQAGTVAFVTAALIGASARWSDPRSPDEPSRQPPQGVINGCVTGPHGPEAGVWLIAETNDLPTTFAKIVVTDERGRYLLPELPQAPDDVWVRGYGLVDSPRQRVTPGRALDLAAVPATSKVMRFQLRPDPLAR